MKIFIITEGGKNIGFGHITRCTSLYQAFEEEGMTPAFVVNGDETVEDLLKGRSYKLFDWCEDKPELFKSVDNADIVIVDSYLADITIYETLSRRISTLVYLDDTKRLNYPRGVLINGNIYAEELNYHQTLDIKYFLGTKYTPLRKPFWNVPKKDIKEKVENIMITFGGNDMRNIIPRILRFLRKYQPNLKKNVIIGKAFQNIDEIEKEADRNTCLIYYPDAERIKNVMLESDIAISAGGQTLYELARVNVPTIAIAVVEHQLQNVRAWQNRQFVEYGGWWRDKTLLQNVKICIEKLKDLSVRESKYKIGKNSVDGKGSLRIVSYLQSMVKK